MTSLIRDWIWVRVAFLVACIVAAYLIWLAVFERPRPHSSDIFTVGALAFGVASVAMGALNWLADANPRVDVLNEHADPVLDRPPDKLGILQLRVDLKDMPPFLRPLVLRAVPQACEIRFWYSEDGAEIEDLSGLLGRWNDNEEPVDYGTGRFDVKTALRNRRLKKLIPLETPYTVAFAVKADGDRDCYHWNDDSYGLGPEVPLWRNPAWCLPSGRYRIRVVLTGYGLTHPVTTYFHLNNDSPDLKQFRVERENV